MTPDVSSAFLVGAVVAFGAFAVLLGLLALNRHAALVAVRRSERSLRDLYDNISEGVFRSTLDGRIISANPALAHLNGFETEWEMLNAVNDVAGNWYVDPARRDEIHRMLAERGAANNVVSEVYRFKTRERIWVEESTRLVRDAGSGRPLCYEGTVREVTDTVSRIQLQERYDKISSVVAGCLYQMRIDKEGHASFPYISSGVTPIYGIRPDELVDDVSILAALVHPDDVDRVRESFARSARLMQSRQDEYRIRSIDGVEKWVLGHAVPEAHSDGSVLWHGFFVDISERKRSEQRIYDLAYRDTLTGLHNRAALVEALQPERAGDMPLRWSALLFIDLDQFKVLNDTKGHHFGDRLLRGVSERLKPIVGDRDLVARLGGDEFVVLVEDIGGSRASAEVQVLRTADRIHATIADPFVIDGFPFHTSASIGAALFRGGEVDADELLKRADMAMYQAKAAGRGKMALFAPGMQTMLEEQLAQTMELRDALDAGSLHLAYQPQVDDAGNCFGVEALLRWDHPVHGQIAPSVFIALAERAGLGAQIDAYVLGAACAVLRRWRDEPTLSHLQMSVNVGNQRLDKSLVALVTNAVRATGADPMRLTIELTERVMLDNVAEVDATLAALKQLGLKIALDDFGTGYSSLSHLKRLPIDTLKIDRSFVDEIETDPNDRVIVQTILNIARNLGVSAIAEGVENEMQALLLRRFGCHMFQGFMYGRPMSVEDFETRMAAAGRPRNHVLPVSRLVV